MRRIAGPYGVSFQTAILAGSIALTACGLPWAAVMSGADRGSAALPVAGAATAVDNTESAEITVGRYLPTNDWADRLGSEDHWRSRQPGARGRYEPPSGVTRIPRADSARADTGRASRPEPSSETARKSQAGVKKVAARKNDDDDDQPSSKGGGGYRTLCVRLCDGYYWPISFATSKSNLGRDAKICERTCGAPARLFFHENPGQQPEEMEDARGKRYKDLKVAYLFRQQYDESCTCKPQPWDEASIARHQRFAELAERKNSGKKGAPRQTKVGPLMPTQDRPTQEQPSRDQASAKATSATTPANPVTSVSLPAREAAAGQVYGPQAAVDSVIRRMSADAGQEIVTPILPPRLQALSSRRRQSLAPRLVVIQGRLHRGTRAISGNVSASGDPGLDQSPGLPSFYQTPVAASRRPPRVSPWTGGTSIAASARPAQATKPAGDGPGKARSPGQSVWLQPPLQRV